MKVLQTVEEFTEVVENNSNVVLMFSASWCNPCKMFTPIMESVSGTIENVIFAKVDVDEMAAVVQRFNIRSVPTLVMLKNGEEVARHSRKQTEAEVKSAVLQAFGI